MLCGLPVPDYLRTKFDPEIEESERKLETLATNIPPEQAQVILEGILASLHLEWEETDSGNDNKQTGNEIEKT